MWNHKGHIVVGGFSTDGLDFAFEVTKTLAPAFDSAVIRIYNVTPSRAEKILRLISFSDQKTEVQLWAGYEDTGVKRLYLGYAASASFEQGEIETELILNCSDTAGGSHLLYSSEAVEGVLAVETLVRLLVSNLGAKPGGLDAAFATPQWKKWSTSQVAPNATLTPGYMTEDTILESLTTIFRSAGMMWTIRDGAFEAFPLGSSIPGTPKAVSTATGMLGAPARLVPAGLLVQHTLDGAFQCGGLVSVTSTRIPSFSGRIDAIRHTGVFSGDDWTTELRLADTTKLAEVDAYA